MMHIQYYIIVLFFSPFRTSREEVMHDSYRVDNDVQNSCRTFSR